MLNARDAEAAYKALSYPKIGSWKERAARDVLLAAYHEEVNRITGEFRNWLAREYAFTLPKTVQNRIWEKAWNDGHHAGYHEVENHYTQYAEFATFAINSVM